MDPSVEKEVNWNTIVQTIDAEKCLLILGPEVFAKGNGEKIEDQIKTFVKEEQNTHIQKYYDDGLFLFQNQEGKTASYYELRSFFQQEFQEAEDLFKKIAQIPFSFIISLTPDDNLSKAYDDQNLRHKVDFYWKNRSPKNIDKLPSKQAPMIYQMFGSFKELDSMVLTHQDVFDYFASIMGNSSMPVELKSIINRIDNFIFIGVPFEKWYFQLMLRILAKLNQGDSFLRFAAGLSLDQQSVNFCQEQFRIQFVPQDIHSFVNKLHEECKKANLLKEVGETQGSPLKGVTDAIRKANTDKAFKLLEEFIEEYVPESIMEEMIELFDTLASRYNRMKKRITKGVISQEESNLQQNQVTESLLELVSRCKNFI